MFFDVTDHVLVGNPKFTMEEAGVGVHQWPAGTYVPSPGDRKGPVFNVVAGIARTSPVVSCKLHIELTVEGFEEHLLGCFVKIHFGQAEPWKVASLQKGDVVHGLGVENFLLHVLRRGLQVAHSEMPGLE